MSKEKKVIFKIDAKTFCDRCKNSDIRQIKDRLNKAVVAIEFAANNLNFKSRTFETNCDELIEWVRLQVTPKKKQG